MVSVTDKHTGTSSKDVIDVAAWLDSLAASRNGEEMALIRAAWEMASGAHAGQTRVSGEPYEQHSLAVAGILASLKLDAEVISAALLHDVVEDTGVPLVDIETRFGPAVARLVDGVTKMDAIQSFADLGDGVARKERQQTEALRKMLLAMVEDVRVVLIKLADRVHNMRTLAALSPEKRRRIAQETLDIYAPLANRLGIWQLKWELEDLAFRHLEPETYKNIAKMVNERRVDREEYLQRFVAELESELAAGGIAAEVKGRPKHIYGIWRKMQRKNVDYKDIYDVRAVRVLVNSIPECYAALGIVHTAWQYVPGEFDDYIATPKDNNYRSIHTAVVGEAGKTVEVQIRTHDMHQHAELGVAAHWRYKEGAPQDEGFDRKVNLLRQLLEWKHDLAETGELMEHLRSDVLEDRVYVFTPKGNVIDLPAGSTPLDFAYQIHTDLGHRCRGAKVNGNMVPLTYTLKTGEQLEILTVKRGDPSRDWLNPHLGYLKTARARSKVQHWFRQLHHDENVAAGRATLDKELHRLGAAGVNYETLAVRLNFSKVDDLLAALGRGDVKTSQIVGVLESISRLKKAEAERQEPVIPIGAPSSRKEIEGFKISGVGDLLTQLAGCCKPVPGDSIAGFITRGRGVTVHRDDCPNLLRLRKESPERIVEVDWGGDATATYPVDVYVNAFDRQGLLRDITALLANEEINVIAVNTLSDKKNHTAQMRLTVEISDLETLSRVLAKINQLPNVKEVRRVGE